MTHPLCDPLSTLANTLKEWRAVIGLTSRPDVFGRVYIARSKDETSDVDLTGVSGPLPITGHQGLKVAEYKEACLNSGEAVLRHIEQHVPIFRGQTHTLCISAQPNKRTGPKFCITWNNRAIFGHRRNLNTMDSLLKQLDTFVENTRHLQPGNRVFEFNDSQEIRAQNANDAYTLFCALWHPETLEDASQNDHLNNVREIINIEDLTLTKV